MPTYTCKLKNAEGKTISANISGGNENDVIRIAEGKGFIVLSIDGTDAEFFSADSKPKPMPVTKSAAPKKSEILYIAEISKMCLLPTGVVFLIGLVVFIIGISSHDNDPAKLFGAIISLLSFVVLINTAVECFTTNFVLRSDKLIAETGLINKASTDIRIEKIESVNVKRGLWGLMFGYGTVYITGTGGVHSGFPYIINPNEVRSILNKALEK